MTSEKTEGPERIWIDTQNIPSYWYSVPIEPGIEYIRSDVALQHETEAVKGLEAEIAELIRQRHSRLCEEELRTELWEKELREMEKNTKKPRESPEILRIAVSDDIGVDELFAALAELNERIERNLESIAEARRNS